MPRPFLTARWSNLLLVSYAVPPSLLRPRVPPGLELDLIDGRALVSLVAFQFRGTRVWGVPWPGYRDFPELNLRFYVRDGSRRGVVFIREYVSSRVVSALARRFYNEPYLTAPLRDDVRADAVGVSATYSLQVGGRQHTLHALGGEPLVHPTRGGLDHSLKELRWGYGTGRDGGAHRYDVAHAAWPVYTIRDYRVDLDWGLVYGPEWAFLTGVRPCSVMLAAGSHVAMFPKCRCQTGPQSARHLQPAARETIRVGG